MILAVRDFIGVDCKAVNNYMQSFLGYLYPRGVQGGEGVPGGFTQRIPIWPIEEVDALPEYQVAR
jgi:hypothetical protein